MFAIYNFVDYIARHLEACCRLKMQVVNFHYIVANKKAEISARSPGLCHFLSRGYMS